MVPEPYLVIRIDDLRRDTSGPIGRFPAAGKEAGSPDGKLLLRLHRRARKLVGLKHLGHPAVEEDPGGWSRGFVGRPSPPAQEPLARPGQQFSEDRQGKEHKEGDEKPLDADERADALEPKEPLEDALGPAPDRGIAVTYLLCGHSDGSV